MSEKTGIEWADSTFNPWIGCTKISLACDNCYAESRMDKRLKVVNWGSGRPRKRTSAANWREPVKWNAKSFYECPACGWRGDNSIHDCGSYECPGCAYGDLRSARRRVFCASLADVFDNQIDPTWRADLFCLIQATPNLDWILLTKRIGNAQAMIEAANRDQDIGHEPEFTPWPWPWPNVWLGATICNQEEADRDIPKLLATRTAKRFVSIEPMLGEITFRWAMWEPFKRDKPTDHLDGLRRLDWVIAGGESGHNARPAHPDWFRSLRDQCASASVPFLFKQWGEWANASYYPSQIQESYARRNLTQDRSIRVGKKTAGNHLDGVQHLEFPK